MPTLPPEFEVETGTRRAKVKASSSPQRKRGASFSGDEIIGTSSSLSVEDLRFKAQIYFAQENWSMAAAKLEQLVRREPTAESYFMLGMCYISVEDYPSAANALAEADRLRPNHLMTLFNLGVTYIKQYLATADIDTLSKAIEPFKKTIVLGQRQAIASTCLGLIYSFLKDWNNAEKYYLRAIKFSPNGSLAYQNLAKLYMDVGDEQPKEREHYYQKAIRMFRKLIEISPRDSDIYNFLGYAYTIIGKTEPAIEAYRKAVEVDADHLLALANLGATYLDARRYEEAKAIYHRILQMNRQFVRTYLTGKLGRASEDVDLLLAEAYTGYGVACMEMYRAQASVANDDEEADPKLLKEAARAFKKAVELNPGNANPLFNLAVLYYRQDRSAEAQEVLRRALEINPDDQNIREHAQKLVEEYLKRKLQEDGLLLQIRKPITDFRPYRNRRAVAVQGRLVSETLVEDRH